MEYNELKRIGKFLGAYSAELLSCGAATIRVEKNTKRIATAYGVDIQMSVFPNHASITVTDKDEDKSFSLVSAVTHHNISFYKNTALSRLSWEIFESHVGVDCAGKEFAHICNTKQNNPYSVMIMVAFANMSFCKLFSGDIYAMITVFIATIIGYGVKICLLKHRWDTRMVFILSAFAAAITGCLCFVFNLGQTPELALGTSVLFLIPGIPFINSVSDLIYKHNLGFLSRIIDAGVLTVCLSIGLILALFVMRIKILS